MAWLSSELTLLYQESSPHRLAVEIIAIHGLQGHSSWDTPDSREPHRTTWLHDRLPTEVPVSTIYTFDYASSWNSRLSLILLAERFLTQLRAVRSENNSTRPIVFLCHSLGGLVLKTAMLRSLEEAGDTFKDIFASSRGIVFFGTPHSGSLSALQTTLVRIGVGVSSRSVLPIAGALHGVMIRFRKLIPHVLTCHLFSFYEQVASPGKDFLAVGLDQTNLSGTARAFLKRSHEDLCRFSQAGNSDFEKLSEILQSFVLSQDIADIRSEQNCHAPNRELLETLHMRALPSPLPTTTNRNTCLWIFEHQMFQTWQQQGSGLLWVTGHPGSGKSTLWKHLVQSVGKRFPKKPDSKAQTIAFQFAAGEHRSTGSSFLISALYQLMISAPGLLSSELVAHFAEKRELAGSTWMLDEDFLMDSLLMFVRRSTGAGYSCWIFIDALDECRDSAGILMRLERLGAESKQPGRVSVCILSRHRPPPSKSLLEICLEDNNLTDIQQYVIDIIVGAAARYDQVIPTPLSSVQTLAKIITEKSSGIFLLAVLLVKNIFYRPVPEKVRLVFNLATFESLYETVVADMQLHNQVDVIQQQVSRKMVMLVVCAKRQLTALELWDATGLRRQRRSQLASTKTMAAPHSGEDITMGVSSVAEEIAYQICSLTGGLLDVTTREAQTGSGEGTHSATRVHLIHESVREFLMKRQHEYREDYGSGEKCNFESEVACICLSYIESATEQEDQTNHNVDNHRNHFLRYAVSYAMHHLSSAAAQGLVPDVDAVRRSPTFQRRALDRWIRLYKAASGDYSLFRPQTSKPAHVMAYFGIPWLQERIWENSAQDLSSEDHHGRTPLAFAAARGHVDLCRALLFHAKDVEHRDHIYGQTPLILASAHGHEEVVKLFLHTSPAAAKGLGGQNALWHAVGNGHLDTVKALLESGAELHARDIRTGQRVLDRACARGHGFIVSLLLDHGARLEHFDARGWSAFHYCIASGRKKTLQILLSRLQGEQYCKLQKMIHTAPSSWVATIFRAVMLGHSLRGDSSEAGCSPQNSLHFEECEALPTSCISDSVGQKRRRANSAQDSDDEDAEEEERSSFQKRPREEKRYACPYHKAYPYERRYSRGACNGEGFENITRLKTHLKNKHALKPPHHRCHQCQRLFTKDKLEQHGQCSKRNVPDAYRDGYDAMQAKKLDAKELHQCKRPGERCWRNMYEILFPDGPVSRPIPSPYQDDHCARVTLPPGNEAAAVNLQHEIARFLDQGGRVNDAIRILHDTAGTETQATNDDQQTPSVSGLTTQMEYRQGARPQEESISLGQNDPRSSVSHHSWSQTEDIPILPPGGPSDAFLPDNLAVDGGNYNFLPSGGSLLNPGFWDNSSYDGSTNLSNRSIASSGIGSGSQYAMSFQGSDNTSWMDLNSYQTSVGDVQSHTGRQNSAVLRPVQGSATMDPRISFGSSTNGMNNPGLPGPLSSSDWRANVFPAAAPDPHGRQQPFVLVFADRQDAELHYNGTRPFPQFSSGRRGNPQRGNNGGSGSMERRRPRN